MHKFLYIVLIAFFPLCAHAENGEPLIVIDGHIGGSKDLIDSDDCYSISMIDSVEAVDRYGKRASGGAMIIYTKEYARIHGMHNTENQQPKHIQRNMATGKYAYNLFLVLQVLLFLWLLYGISCIILKIAAAFVKSPQNYIPGPFDHEGVIFNEGKNFPSFIKSVFFVLLLGTAAIIRPAIKYGENMDNVLIIYSIGLFAVMGYTLIKTLLDKSECYIRIDDYGIHSTHNETFEENDSPQNIVNIDIRWNDIQKLSINSITLPKKFFPNKYLTIYTTDNPNSPAATICLEQYPSRKLVDCINYFYSNCNKPETSIQQPIIQPLGFDNSFWLKIILTLCLAAAFRLFIYSKLGLKLLAYLVVACQ